MQSSAADVKRVGVQWPRFGPYHLARLDALARVLGDRSVELVALETASDDVRYGWRVETGPTAFRRVQLFRGRRFEELAPREIHAAVVSTLERLSPEAVAITSYSGPDARACLAWCRAHRRTAVLMLESKEDDAPRRAWRELVKRALVSQYDAALVGGAPQRAYLEKLGFPSSLIFLGYDVVDNRYFHDGAAAVRRDPSRSSSLPGLDSDDPFFLASGRFVPRKNFATLLESYRLYRERSARPWRLILLGDGPQRPQLVQLIADRRIGGVVLAGFRQIDELVAYYARARAFIHPARVEMWGLVVNEAMAASLPVIVAKQCGCSHDLVRDGDNGFRFDAEDAGELAGLMERLARPETDLAAMGARSAAIIESWSPEWFASQLWRAVVAGRARSSRPASWTATMILNALRYTARSVRSFHSVRT